MKDSSLQKIVDHQDREEIVSKLVIGVSPADINEWLRLKYAEPDNKQFIISAKILKDFKDNYLNLYQKIQNDVIQIKQEQVAVAEEAKSLVENNSAYKRKLAEYIDKEIDLKQILQNLVIIIQDRIEQIYNIMHENPGTFKPDYILIQYLNTLVSTVEKANVVINGSPDQIVQHNNINIQVLDRQMGVIHKVIRDILSKLDYETSLHFIELYAEEMKKLENIQNVEVPVDIRFAETKQLAANIID